MPVEKRYDVVKCSAKIHVSSRFQRLFFPLNGVLALDTDMRRKYTANWELRYTREYICNYLYYVKGKRLRMYMRSNLPRTRRTVHEWKRIYKMHTLICTTYTYVCLCPCICVSACVCAEASYWETLERRRWLEFYGIILWSSPITLQLSSTR